MKTAELNQTRLFKRICILKGYIEVRDRKIVYKMLNDKTMVFLSLN